MRWISRSERDAGRPATRMMRANEGRRRRAALRRALAAAVPAILALSIGTAAERAPDATLEPAARLAARMLAETPLADDIRHLCDRIGGRMTGSDACERSVDWFVERFRAAGVDRTWTEPFEMPFRWSEGASRARALAPESFPVDVVALPHSPATPSGGLAARVVDLGDGEPEVFVGPPAGLEGALGLVGSEVIASWGDLFQDYMRIPPIIERARKARMAGLLLIGSRSRDLLYRHIPTLAGWAPFPMAVVAREDGLRLARLARRGEVRLSLDLRVRSGPPYTARNVLAEIRGRERPGEIVLLGAHLDSWDLGTGALDNGANCAMLLDLARQLAALGARPRRTVRIALFTGEEQGLHGSLGYVRRHRDALGDHVAVAIFDEGTGRIGGFSTGGREDLHPLVIRALRPVAGFGADAHTADAFVGTDNLDFLLEGVPNLVATQAAANYMENYHASSDTFDKVDLREIRINGAIAAALAWHLADSDARAPRQDRAAIEDLVRRTGLEGQLRTFGLWDDWAGGRRGRVLE